MQNIFDEPQKVYKFHDVDENKQVSIKAWSEKGAWNQLMQIDNYKQRFVLLVNE